MYFLLPAIKTRHQVTRKEMIDSEPSAVGKNDGFWLLWGIFMEYIETKYYYGSVKISEFLFSWLLEIDKKSEM